MTQTLYIGIDAGTHTGVAVWNSREQRLELIDTMTITQAMDYVRGERMRGFAYGFEVVVCMEDARLRNWFGQSGREKLQGAGSVKRDCAIWETFCKEIGIECVKIPPKHNTTKLKDGQFKLLTGWHGRTSEHGRDAAMLVFGR